MSAASSAPRAEPATQHDRLPVTVLSGFLGAGTTTLRQTSVASWRQHVQSAAYAVTCVAMLVLQQLAAAPGALLEQVVYLSASALAGVARFAVLRLVVFARNRSQAAATVRPAHATVAHASTPADPRVLCYAA